MDHQWRSDNDTFIQEGQQVYRREFMCITFGSGKPQWVNVVKWIMCLPHIMDKETEAPWAPYDQMATKSHKWEPNLVPASSHLHYVCLLLILFILCCGSGRLGFLSYRSWRCTKTKNIIAHCGANRVNDMHQRTAPFSHSLSLICTREVNFCHHILKFLCTYLFILKRSFYKLKIYADT